MMLYLGSRPMTNNNILIKLRKLVIFLFILCELTAQFFLAKRIFICRNLISSFTFKAVIYLKIAFVDTIILISTIIIGTLAIYDLPPNVDYFLEWNYFLVLLFFYLLSSKMWKKLPQF